MSSVDAKSILFALLKGNKASTGYYGVSDVTDNTDEIYDSVMSSEAEADRVKRLAKWQELKGGIPVYGESIHTVMRSPAVYVFRNGYRSQGNPLGFLEDTVDSESSNYFEHEFMARGIDQLRISVFGNTPNQRDELFVIVRELLFRGVSYLSSRGAKGFQILNAKDGQFVVGRGQQATILHGADIDIQLLTQTTWTERERKSSAILTEYQVTPYEETT